MCQAINYAQQLNEVYTKIKEERYALRRKIAETNNIQMDITHYIENYDLTEEESLLIIKRFHELRKERRKMKYELELLDKLWEKIEPFRNYTKLNTEIIPTIKNKEKELMENWKYKYRSNFFKVKGSTLTKQQIIQEEQHMQRTAITIRPVYDFILVD